MPKLIYLDQNKWIDLARVITKPDQNTQHREVYQLIESKVSSREWAFPLSSIHFIETLRRSDPESRQKLALVMSKISRNAALKSYVDIEEIELFNWLAKTHAPQEVQVINPVEYNFLAAIGVDRIELSVKNNAIEGLGHELETVLINLIYDDRLFENILMSFERNPLISGVSNDDSQAVAMWTKEQSFLKSIPKDQKYKVFLVRQMAPFLSMAASNFASYFNLQKHEVIPYDALSIKKEANVSYFEDIPSLNTRICLMFDRVKNPNHKIHLHDSRDISFLATAIPYCDVVITERTWKHAANSQGLCKKYNTVVESDLNYLLNL